MASLPQTEAGAVERGTDIILASFEDLLDRFRTHTRRAVERFEAADWPGLQLDTVRRLGLHTRSVDEALQILREQLGPRVDQPDFWADLKRCYAEKILGRDDFELAQTYFNSVTRHLFSHVGVDSSTDFLTDDFPLPYKGWELAAARTYVTREVTPTVLRRILLDAGLRCGYRDLDGETRAAVALVRQRLESTFGDDGVAALDFLRPVFVRNKAAYLIGRARRADGSQLPLAFALLHGDGGLTIDAVVCSESGVSIIFSFARWYFHVDVRSPRPVIGFLHSILPRKTLAELYISLGHNKHGKTEFYRDLVRYIKRTDERFVHAPGRPGLVMSVFTLPSYPFVFKVIKDRFPPPKHTTRERVMERYRLVHLHDRVGRLVDFQEFEHLEFPRERFSDELLAELLEQAGKTVSLVGDQVSLRHLYIGRRVTPLDLFLETAPEEACRAAVVDWGQAIKDLAAADIFAGDMLLKNFGVTRHGRVVFYDYDELCPLTECRFRRMPEPRTEEEALAAEPWFSVAEGDVFPEELERFLGFGGELRELFFEHHADLFDVAYWRAVQDRQRAGEVIDFYPYADEQRLGEARPPRRGSSSF